MQVVNLLLPLIIGLCIGAIAAWAVAVSRHRAESVGAEARVTALEAELDRAHADRDRAEQRALERERSARAESLATADVLKAITPVTGHLRTLDEKIGRLEEERREQHGQLSQQLRSATESEERLRRAADGLAAAMTSHSTRGVWGEVQLRRVVEAAGLLERVDFDVQSAIETETGSARPDLVVHLPGGRHLAVDAKVPFAAHLEASAIPATASDEELARKRSLEKRHSQAVRGHIDQLASKAYWTGVADSPELVIAFLPSESLISAALAADPSLLDYAFSKRVALASPVSLWSVLKTVAHSWRQDAMTTEARALFDASRELHSRLATTAAHLDKLGRSLGSSVQHYNRFVGSMERSVLPSARRITALDAEVPFENSAPVDEAPRELSAPEFVEALRDEVDAE